MLRMVKCTKNIYHISVLNGLVTKLETIRVKIKDEDKALRLL